MTILCQSVQAHPTLTSLDLRSTRSKSLTGERMILPEQQNAHRTRVLAEMMQENTILRTIELSEDARDEQIYTEKIHPLLEANLYRARVLAIKKAGIFPENRVRPQ
jgi:hypothetical protein